MAQCIIDGCPNPAHGTIAVQFKAPDVPRKIEPTWLHDTNAAICDQHASGGLRIEVLMTPNGTDQRETLVHNKTGQCVSRVRPLK